MEIRSHVLSLPRDWIFPLTVAYSDACFIADVFEICHLASKTWMGFDVCSWRQETVFVRESSSRGKKSSTSSADSSRGKNKTSLVFQKAEAVNNDIIPVTVTSSRSSTRRSLGCDAADGLEVLSPWHVTAGSSIGVGGASRKPVNSVKQSKGYPLTTEL